MWLESITRDINKVVLALNPQHKEFYDRLYRHNQSKVRICMEMFIEEPTFYKYKDKIIYDLAKETGRI